MPRRTRRAGKRPIRLLLTCEHGGNRIPRRYAPLFRGAADVVRSHRGWDPGALALARLLGRSLGVPVHAVTWCRLLVESNRAPTNPRIWSPYTAGLPAAEQALCRRWKAILESRDPSLRVRLNYPYRGAADGLPTWLRRRYAPDLYAGVEFEASQGILAGKRSQAVQRAIADSLVAVISGADTGP
jgi:predicted N-formylglutamate amidohydrolase